MSRPKGSKNKKTLEAEAKEKKVETKEKKTLTNVKKVAATAEEAEAKTEALNKTKNKDDKYPKCELCGAPMKSSPYTLRLTEMTGLCMYHREIKDQIKVCHDCSHEFSEYVEKWLIKKGAPRRIGWDMKKNDKDETRGKNEKKENES